jgi:hypothetical protein
VLAMLDMKELDEGELPHPRGGLASAQTFARLLSQKTSPKLIVTNLRPFHPPEELIL